MNPPRIPRRSSDALWKGFTFGALVCGALLASTLLILGALL